MIRLWRYWARTSDKTKKSLRGSSLLETMIAMTILLTILTLSVTVLSRINHSQNPQATYKAHLATNYLLCQDELLIQTDELFMVDGFRVTRQIESLGEDLYEVQLQVFDATEMEIYVRKLIWSHAIQP